VDDNGGDATKSLEIVREFYRGKVVAEWKAEGMSQTQLAAMLLSSFAGIHYGGNSEATLAALRNPQGDATRSNPRVTFIEQVVTESWDAFTQQLRVATANDPKAINLRDVRENTPLMWAAARGDLELTKWLIEQGADLKAQGGDGRTAHKLAEMTKHQDIAALLRNAEEQAR
jgi:ankyrin repeat protein